MTNPTLTFITGDFAPMVGGIASYMTDLVGALPPEQVRVIATPSPGSSEFDSMQRYAIDRLKTPSWLSPTPQTMKLLSYQYLQMLLAAPAPDFVLCCHGRLWLMAAAATYQRLRRAPFGVFLHGTDILDARKRRSAVLYDNLLRSAFRVLPNSRLTASSALDAGVDAGRVETLHPCINQAKLIPTQPPGVLRRRLGIGDRRVLLSVARLVDNKGIDIVLKALPSVLDSYPETHYVIAGDGPSRESLESLAATLGIAANVSFIGRQARDNMANIYQEADLFVLTPRTLKSGPSEGFGLVYLEANMLELPVVAADIGGIRDAVTQNVNGLVVPPESIEATSQALRQLLAAPDYAAELGQRGQRRAIADFSCSAAATRLLNVLTKPPVAHTTNA